MSIEDRKVDHLSLCAEDEVEYRSKTTLFDDVELMHDSLPELAIEEIDTSVEIFGKRLAAPLLVTGMTGGAELAKQVNRTLASVAQQLGIAFGVGSQRAMIQHPELLSTYQVRDVAPDIVLFANIGVVQLAQMTPDEAKRLVDAIEADALCVHLNPGQELIQPEGDRDFRGCLAALERTVEALDIPIIAKETGCGMSPRTLARLAEIGISWVDVSGAGGTTWIGVETKRATPHKQAVGESFWEWGVPTAASIVFARRQGLRAIGSGGLRGPLDAVKAIALGADLAGMALPWLKASMESEEAAIHFGEVLIDGVAVGCALTGSKSLKELREAPKVIGPRLGRWLDSIA